MIAMSTHRIDCWIIIFVGLVSAIAATVDAKASVSMAQVSHDALPSARFTSNCSERKTPGLICEECNLLSRCVRINDEWMTIPVELCNTEGGEYCNVAARGCSNVTGPCNPIGSDASFKCTSEGVFPDPFDCQKYHMCYRIEHTNATTIECGGDRAFSAATGDCSLTLNDSVCTQSQFSCHHPGESQSWPGNRNIFYICHAMTDRGQRVLFPRLYRCAADEVFSGTDCVPREQQEGEEGEGDGEAPEQFRCHKVGLVADANDCKSYYYCDYSLRWLRYTCEAGTYFDNRTKACVRGTC